MISIADWWLHWWEANPEIQNFREYLRIPSVHPNSQAADLELPVQVFHPVNNENPIVILTWTGTEPDLPSILLNSHMDVVPAYHEHWTHPRFGADMDREGKIYARGSQDMKCVSLQYLGAIRALKKSGARFKRSIHISFVPEMGGGLGMGPFVKTSEFKALNVGFSLDEGLASSDDVFPVFYAERTGWHVNFKILGTHGSLFLKNTAGEKLQYILNKIMEIRQQQVSRLEKNPELAIADVTSINLTQLNGGVQSNVIPPEITAGFDIRLALDVDHGEFELHQWCNEAGGGIELEYDHKPSRVEPTVTDETNPFWLAFKAAIDNLGLKTKLQIFAAGTDSRFIREAGIPALGFSPMNNTPVLLHDNNEFIGADVYLRGIEIYKKIIPNLANAM